MRKLALLATMPILLAACSRPTAAGTYLFDARTDAARGGLPGAEKIALVLKPDGKITMEAGPMTLLSTTWKEEGNRVTFGQGQGPIGAESKYADNALIPIEKGAEGTAWRFTKR